MPNYYGNLVTPVGHADVVTVTLSAHTDANAVLDVIAAPQEITQFFRVPGGAVEVVSFNVLDKDDQGQNLDILFLNATGSIGAESAAFAPTDAVLETIIGCIPATNWIDATNSQLAVHANYRQIMKATAAEDSVWVAAVCREGTPTYSAAGLIVQLGIVRY